MTALLAGAECPFEAAGKETYSRRDFEAIADITYKAAGILLPEGKAMLVYSRLTKRLRDTGITRFSDYIELMLKDDAEKLRAITLLTTNHTMFFREEHHFDHFTKELRPQLIDNLLAGKRVRMWSAGSSSGEEVYSLAMTLAGSDKMGARRFLSKDVAILASDLSDKVIAKGREGRYAADAVDAVPSALRHAWVKSEGDTVVIAPELRELVRFKRLNLLTEWPFKGPFDVIFCRNVMIYFDEPTKARLLHRFEQNLAPGGFLYIGHSERLVGPATDKFTLVGKTIYRKDP